MTAPSPSKSTAYTWLLSIIPLWLLISAGAALVYFLQQKPKEQELENTRFAQKVSPEMIADDLKKITEFIGERNTSNPTTRQHLSRISSMVQGSLGPSNAGYPIKLHRTSGEHPIIEANLKGTQSDAPSIWILCSMDSPRGSSGIECNATGLAATMAAAQKLTNERFTKNIHFLFIPYANDPLSPRQEISSTLQTLIPKNAHLFYVEAMGQQTELWLSSNQPDAFPPQWLAGLGSRKDLTGLPSHPDLAYDSLINAGFPTLIRISTRFPLNPSESDHAPPSATIVAAATGRLIDFITRCAISNTQP
jgi:hypothetical protein